MSVILLDQKPMFTQAKLELMRLYEHRSVLALHEVEFREYEKSRTLKQNAYLWVAINTPLAKRTGCTPAEMHEILLGEVFGYVEIVFRGRTKQVPRRRSSDLNTTEFGDYLEHCHRICAEEGVYVAPYQS